MYQKEQYRNTADNLIINAPTLSWEVMKLWQKRSTIETDRIELMEELELLEKTILSDAKFLGVANEARAKKAQELQLELDNKKLDIIEINRQIINLLDK